MKTSLIAFALLTTPALAAPPLSAFTHGFNGGPAPFFGYTVAPPLPPKVVVVAPPVVIKPPVVVTPPVVPPVVVVTPPNVVPPLPPMMKKHEHDEDMKRHEHDVNQDKDGKDKHYGFAGEHFMGYRE